MPQQIAVQAGRYCDHVRRSAGDQSFEQQVQHILPAARTDFDRCLAMNVVDQRHARFPGNRRADQRRARRVGVYDLVAVLMHDRRQATSGREVELGPHACVQHW